METKKCKLCGEEITGKREDAVFCSNTCKAKFWEQNKTNKEPQQKEKPQENKDVTSQLRGVLNGVVPQNGEIIPGNSEQRFIKTIVPLYNEMKKPFEDEIRRLKDVRRQLISGIEEQKDKLNVILKQNGNILVLRVTGAGAVIGDLMSEDKKKGTIIGAIVGFIGGAIIEEVTKNIREEEKRIDAERMVAEINSKISKLYEIDKQISAQQVKIMVLPRLKYKEVLVPAPLSHNNKSEILAGVPHENSPKPAPRLETDVSDVNLTSVKSDKIINSCDLKKMDFKVLDFRGRWNEFFGYPSHNFHCIVHGMPGEGKSTFAIQFAKYLAENIGRVMYVSGEEGFTKTLKDKFINNDGISRYIDIADLRTFDDFMKNVPYDLYNFIFIDSLDNMRIDASKMKIIRERYKNSALITISQSTKDGKMKGSQELVHDCDMSVVVENGIAKTDKNRFKAKWMVYEVFS